MIGLNGILWSDKMADLYTMLGFSAGMIILILGIVISTKVLSGEFNILSEFFGADKKGFKNYSNICQKDNDCVIDGKRFGVCVASECTCFLDSHCDGKCDMSVGKCIVD